MKPPCDVVMKGGITSGIVYPSAVYEIAKHFRFVNIGGTSAGAIAAVATAAAERRRTRSNGADESGFDEVAAIPDELAEDNLLFRLFRPNRGTKKAFDTITFLLGRAPVVLKAGVVFTTPWALLGMLPAIILFLLSARNVADIAFAVLLALALAAPAGALALTISALTALKANYFGLVTGFDEQAEGVALTSWLEEKLERIAGITAPRTPLTFTMLWNAAGPEEATATDDIPEHSDINLEMISTILTYGRPVQFPCATSSLFFRIDDLDKFFPPHVVDWMYDNRRPPRTGEEQRIQEYAAQGYYPLPPIGDLPVIVATRMSLAFPVLLSAVPLYAADFSLRENQDRQQTPHLESVWFSDGGLSSNFPISMFDAPLPRWPTFAINLGQFTDDYPEQHDEDENVYMPRTNGAARLPQFNRFSNLFGFLGAIFDAARNWRDNVQMVLPGYRDRVVTIKLSAAEGGLNLDMPADLLMRLKKRGTAAGRRLVERFGNPDGSGPPEAPEMGWENHRWLRFRSTMGALRTYSGEFAAGATPLPADPPYATLIAAHEGQGSYPVASGTAPQVSSLLSDTVSLGQQYAATPALQANLPKPPLDLSMAAPLKHIP